MRSQGRERRERFRDVEDSGVDVVDTYEGGGEAKTDTLS
jgi:hypothetical protein